MLLDDGLHAVVGGAGLIPERHRPVNLGLELRVVELRQERPPGDGLSLAERQAHDHGVDFGDDRDRVRGLDAADRFKAIEHGLPCDERCLDRHGRHGETASRSPAGATRDRENEQSGEGAASRVPS